MDTLYRIHTEVTTPAHEANIHALVSPYFEAYNVLYGDGSWRGQRERSATVEVYAKRSAATDALIVRIVQGIRAANKQEAVLLATISASAQLY